MSSDIMKSEWRNDANTLMTRLSGPVDLKEVEAWRDGLYEAAEGIPEGRQFRMLIDLRGYEVADIDRDVHMVQRLILPVFLLEHGYRIAYFDLYPEAEEPEVRKRSSSCIAVAHVHHDCNKMDLYNMNLGRPRERFFCTIEEAEQWISDPETQPA